jgi:hypothetical protein
MLLNAEVFRAIGKTVLFSINQHGTIYIIISPTYCRTNCSF